MQIQPASSVIAASGGGVRDPGMTTPRDQTVFRDFEAASAMDWDGIYLAIFGNFCGMTEEEREMIAAASWAVGDDDLFLAIAECAGSHPCLETTVPAAPN